MSTLAGRGHWGTGYRTIARNNGDPEGLFVKYKDGEKKVILPPNTPIVAYAPGDRNELKPGAHVIIFAASKQADGSFTAPAINVGRDGVVPPIVTARTAASKRPTKFGR